ncbi:predicted protein [Sclerotinia sclerotiorum 1980 UF-70]|uniref:Uncharacterized protein n=1 Tax=Sclerotinia sclerotiorum (strain ATCC 18683 / 1980 / Ss-1) TaxID=665079 RepID=A7ECF4_SCLS1|nr:predicted protein [Sclerotinia sclerotiorum 1980 UF-70]EDO00133.1 predicted protein [Sclerotinia sclerotiorum 1980 UF-70]
MRRTTRSSRISVDDLTELKLVMQYIFACDAMWTSTKICVVNLEDIYERPGRNTSTLVLSYSSSKVAITRFKNKTIYGDIEDIFTV